MEGDMNLLKTSNRLLPALIALAAVVATMAPADSVRACSIPVFRYGLERWPADPYELVVFHRGPLSDEHQQVYDWLETVGPEDGAGANIRLYPVDLDGEVNPQFKTLWETQNEANLPWAAALYPQPRRQALPAWTGEFNASAARALVQSPARQTMAKRILDGETAVWVLLESGDRAKDDAAAKLIGDQLTHLAATLKIEGAEDVNDPAEALDPADKLKSELPLRVAFSMIRVSRDDPAESMLVEMLLGSEVDLRDFNEPMAFPVFARGRALYALVGKGINVDNIYEACAFLVGWCSCQVKSENPGTDLLITVDWDASLSDLMVKDVELPPLRGLGAMVSSAATGTTTPPALTPTTAVPVPSGAIPVWRSWLSSLRLNIMFAIALVVIIAIAWVLFTRQRGERN